MSVSFSLACLAILLANLLAYVTAVPGSALFITGDDYIGVPPVKLGPDFSIETWLFVTEANTEVFGEVRFSR